MGYWKLFRTEPRTLLFGVLNGFFSGLGQTHFISLFGPMIMAQLHLNNTQYGSLYSLATLASAFVLPLFGPLIDKVDIRYFCMTLGFAIVLLEFLFAEAQSLVLLFIVLFGLRLTGQGLLAQVSSTTIARYFVDNRGKALSLMNLGFPLAEGLLTPLIAFLMTQTHESAIHRGLGFIVLVIYIPLMFFLTKGNTSFNKPFHSSAENITDNDEKEELSSIKHWTRKEVFKDKLVYFLVPHILMPPFSLTGLIFHQGSIAALKGWSLSLIAGGLTFFALTRILFSFIVGPQVDKYTAAKLLPFYLIPLAMGFVSLSVFSNAWTPALCFALFGISVGCGGPIKSALWAELYGTKHLGAIKSTLATLMVFSTALSPFLFGWCLDQWGEVHSLLWSMTIFTALSSTMSWLALRKA